MDIPQRDRSLQIDFTNVELDTEDLRCKSLDVVTI